MFFGHHQEHSTTGWLEGIILVSYGVLFGTTTISKEILDWLPFTSSLVAFSVPLEKTLEAP